MTLAPLLTVSLALLVHDSWISSGGFRNQAGEWCCGEKDCEVVEAKQEGNGYRVQLPRGGVISEWVPFRETLPSPDGLYWRCHRVDGQRLCFFAPPNAY